MKKFISYLRVSTKQQGVSGLGLDAQQSEIRSHIQRENGTLVAEYTEVESGGAKSASKRVEIKNAVAHCKSIGAILIIAKLDRLARDTEFVLSIYNTPGLEIVFCDFPQANRMMITILSAIAEYEKEQISHRTKVALLARKSKRLEVGMSVTSKRYGPGTVESVDENGGWVIYHGYDPGKKEEVSIRRRWNYKLGNPHPEKSGRKKEVRPVEPMSMAEEFVKQRHNAGMDDARLAHALNSRGERTAKGKLWSRRMVCNLRKAILQKEIVAQYTSQ